SAACRDGLSLEAPVFPGNGQLEPLSESIRRYVMSHFRWDKFGRRNSSSGSSGSGSSAGSHKRREGSGNIPALPGPHSQRREEKEDGKRSYSMEHFRWGKPVGRKRRPVKVYPNALEEEQEQEEEEEEAAAAAREFPLEFRRELGGRREGGKSRWESPLDKRYGGFMGSESSRTPLLTLFRNTIGKSASQKGP
ncbi:pro-opiomelanocortin-like, partial [Myiozetetes cayanensis]|uniref:pro-opiomelanocortin-like n=1 Tax=Myiozetetes cayanensis TaxID=478635 RepID=UPI00215F6B1D